MYQDYQSVRLLAYASTSDDTIHCTLYLGGGQERDAPIALFNQLTGQHLSADDGDFSRFGRHYVGRHLLDIVALPHHRPFPQPLDDGIVHYAVCVTPAIDPSKLDLARFFGHRLSGGGQALLTVVTQNRHAAASCLFAWTKRLRSENLDWVQVRPVNCSDRLSAELFIRSMTTPLCDAGRHRGIWVSEG